MALGKEEQAEAYANREGIERMPTKPRDTAGDVEYRMVPMTGAQLERAAQAQAKGQKLYRLREIGNQLELIRPTMQGRERILVDCVGELVELVGELVRDE